MTEQDKKYIWDLMPSWVKTVPKGLCPTMYGTGSYEGDLKVRTKVAEILEMPVPLDLRASHEIVSF